MPHPACPHRQPGRPSHEGRGLKLHDDEMVEGRDRRPSHEGRGLKYLPRPAFSPAVRRPSHEGRGLK